MNRSDNLAGCRGLILAGLIALVLWVCIGLPIMRHRKAAAEMEAQRLIYTNLANP